MAAKLMDRWAGKVKSAEEQLAEETVREELRAQTDEDVLTNDNHPPAR